MIESVYFEESSENWYKNVLNNTIGAGIVSDEIIGSILMHYNNLNDQNNNWIENLITSTELHLQMISLKINLVKSCLSESNLIIIDQNNTFFCFRLIDSLFLDLTNNNPRKLYSPSELDHHLQTDIKTMSILSLSFTPFQQQSDSALNLSNLLTEYYNEIITILICKPNGIFIAYSTYRDHPVSLLHNWLCNLTGYLSLRLFTREFDTKLIISDLSTQIGRLNLNPGANIIFSEAFS